MPLNDVFDILDEPARGRLRKRSQPRWTAPMLATLTRDTFWDPEWLYERKLDGVRCLAFRRGKRLRLLSRNRKELNDTYPELARDLGKEPCRDFVVDGEIVALEGARTSFARLQRRIGIQDPRAARRTGVAVTFYLFDLLHLQGRDVTQLSLHDRKRLLKRALSFTGHVRFTPHRVEAGEELLEEACRKGWEGLIAKRAASRYVHRRSRDWLKFKCGNRQELVIGGYTDPKGSRIGFGALLVGYYEGGALRYAGKVGTGYDDALLEQLAPRLARMERKTCPFEKRPRVRDAHWVSPRLVGEVGFSEWTGDGKLRHPRFLGLRPDKSPRQVRRERARPAPI
jgi:bifunctional non-homologous end joining protein LigD